MSNIPIKRRGWYRAPSKPPIDFTLLIPVQWHPRMTFRDLVALPNCLDWKHLEYVRAPRAADEKKVAL